MDDEKYATIRQEIHHVNNQKQRILTTANVGRGCLSNKLIFVNYVENEGTLEAFKKSRFVMSAFNETLYFPRTRQLLCALLRDLFLLLPLLMSA